MWNDCFDLFNENQATKIEILRCGNNITNMSFMFAGCTSLTTIDLTKLNTQNVTDMSQMFYDCSSLTSLNLSNFKTEKVTDMGRMFNQCFKFKYEDSMLICTIGYS